MSLLNQVIADFGSDILSKDSEAVKKEATKAMAFTWPAIDASKVVTLGNPPFERIIPKEGKEDKKLYSVYFIEEDGQKYVAVQGESTIRKLFASAVFNDIAIDHECKVFSGLTWEITSKGFKAKNETNGKEEDRIYHNFTFLANRSNLAGKTISDKNVQNQPQQDLFAYAEEDKTSAHKAPEIQVENKKVTAADLMTF